MTKFEKIVYVGCPWLFGMVMIINGVYLGFAVPKSLAGLASVGLGLTCVSLYCVCSLLAKLVETKKT